MLRKAYLMWALPAIALLSSASMAVAGGQDDPFAYNAADTAKWSGVYIGLHGGFGWGDTNSGYDFGSNALNNILFNDVGLKSGIQDSLDGYIVGGQIGVQHQIGRWVIGLEGTASATGMDDTSSAKWSFDNIVCPFGCFGTAGQGTQTLDVKLRHLYTVTGRLGYAFDDWMAYVKGGYATADMNVSSNISGDVTGCFFGCATTSVSTSGGDRNQHNGWVIGGGLERMIAPNVTLGVEYNYINLDSQTYAFNAPLNVGNVVNLPASYKVRIDPDAIQTVSLRLNLLLNAPDRPEAVSLK